MNGWQPIETAPKDGSLVDLWCVHTTMPAVRSADMSWRRGKWRQPWGQELNPGWHASHWMPPPDPPNPSPEL